MRISVVGAGYVGLVSASCLADSGHNVICIDNDEKKVSRLKTGVIDIFEPGLKDIIESNLKRGIKDSPYMSYLDAEVISARRLSKSSRLESLVNDSFIRSPNVFPLCLYKILLASSR